MSTTAPTTDHHTDRDAIRILVATAWKDRGLSDLELAAVCLEIMRDPTSDLSCRDALRGWLGSSSDRPAHYPAAPEEGSRTTTAVSPGRSAA